MSERQFKTVHMFHYRGFVVRIVDNGLAYFRYEHIVKDLRRSKRYLGVYAPFQVGQLIHDGSATNARQDALDYARRVVDYLLTNPKKAPRFRY